MESNVTAELRRTWEAAATGWARWEERFSAGLGEATEALLDIAAIRSGMRVLDLACGAGSQTLQAARRVGPTGQIVAAGHCRHDARPSARECPARRVDQYRNA
jgi:ubiquinone/menaquinone biosynthesis C-methylase UbiE